MAASFRIKGYVDEGNRYDTVRLVIDETIQTRTLPLLNYIFFETNSAELPERYVLGGESALDSFDPQGIRYINAVDLYKHILDIVGYRMHAKPTTSIVVTGTMSVLDTDTSVAKRRAQVIYLHPLAVSSGGQWGGRLYRTRYVY